MFNAKTRASIHSSIYLFSLEDIDWVFTLCKHSAEHCRCNHEWNFGSALSITKECTDIYLPVFLLLKGLPWSSPILHSPPHCIARSFLIWYNFKNTFPLTFISLKSTCLSFPLLVSFSQLLCLLCTHLLIHLFFLALFIAS